MGTCKYCGKDAGLFSHEHKECEEKHEQGILSLEDGIRKFNPSYSVSVQGYLGWRWVNRMLVSPYHHAASLHL